MPRSRSVNVVKQKSKKRSVSLNLERARENKRKHNASNKIKKFIRRVNNKHKGKLQLSRRNFNRAYQDQEQARQELYRQRHIPVPYLGKSRVMTNNELDLYENLDENTSAPYYPEAAAVQLARPENKRKTVKNYRSVAMLVPPSEDYIRFALEQENRKRERLTRQLHQLYMEGFELNQGNDEATKELDLQIKEKK